MTKIPVAIAQSRPIPLDFAAGVAEAARIASEAMTQGAKLIAFGETFLGGYPLWLDEAPGAALWGDQGAQILHRVLLENALVLGDPRWRPLQILCDRHDAVISIGTHERLRRSLYNTQYILRPGKPPLPHRKLMPTHGERLVWMRGDGSTLNVHEANWGGVGNLICWEHWMPLARAAMHNLGEAVHVAAWPTVRDSYAVASRHYAMEGRCFVLAAGLVQDKADLVASVRRMTGDGPALDMVERIAGNALNRGGSLIAAPDARVMAQAGEGEEILMAELDLAEIAEGLSSLDTDGHYSRPDVFELRVDRTKQPGVRWDG